MEIVEISSESAIIQFSRYDLEILHDALNDVCRDMTEEQFEARLGYSLTESKRLLEKLAQAYKVLTGS